MDLVEGMIRHPKPEPANAAALVMPLIPAPAAAGHDEVAEFFRSVAGNGLARFEPVFRDAGFDDTVRL